VSPSIWLHQRTFGVSVETVSAVILASQLWTRPSFFENGLIKQTPLIQQETYAIKEAADYLRPHER